MTDNVNMAANPDVYQYLLDNYVCENTKIKVLDNGCYYLTDVHSNDSGRTNNEIYIPPTNTAFIIHTLSSNEHWKYYQNIPENNDIPPIVIIPDDANGNYVNRLSVYNNVSSNILEINQMQKNYNYL